LDADVNWITEPELLFGMGQKTEDPRDGLTLFGPLDADKAGGIRPGVVGTRNGINRFVRWSLDIQRPILGIEKNRIARPPFPGFQAAFGIPWQNKPVLTKEVNPDELAQVLHLEEGHIRVFRAVEIYVRAMETVLKEEEVAPNIWFIIIPDEVKQLCRPKSRVDSESRLPARAKPQAKHLQQMKQMHTLFKDHESDMEPYYFEVNFHNQLKARLLKHKVPTQIVLESTIAFRDFVRDNGSYVRDLTEMESAIAWNLSTASFYKAGWRPWKIAAIRDGVCYVGLVFKKDDTSFDERSACCAAQMFLDSGDGIVFKGNLGPWYDQRTKQYHLSRHAAYDLIKQAVSSYRDRTGGDPRELFIHGRTFFSDEEWRGFEDAVNHSTNIVGIRIVRSDELRLYRIGRNPVLRGLTHTISERLGYLWTSGFIPRIRTYAGREVPRPLQINICRGSANLDTVFRDIMALTKLNYNTCMYADGLPVTLRFADSVGEILTAGPIGTVAPLPFKYYI
jgi:hypothetical protein